MQIYGEDFESKLFSVPLQLVGMSSTRQHQESVYTSRSPLSETLVRRGVKAVVSTGRAQGTPPGPEEVDLGEQEPGSPDYQRSLGVHACSVVTFRPLPWGCL